MARKRHSGEGILKLPCEIELKLGPDDDVTCGVSQEADHTAAGRVVREVTDVALLT
jgi:hypothetical protein